MKTTLYVDDKAIQTHPGPTFYLVHPLSNTVRKWVPARQVSLKGQADLLSLFLMGWFDSSWTYMLEVHLFSQQTLLSTYYVPGSMQKPRT